MDQKKIKTQKDLFNKSNLTRSQFLIWMGQKLNPDAPLYNMALTYTINGKVDPRIFQAAFQTVVDESDAMRMVVDEQSGVPQQRVLPQLSYSVDCLDFRQKNDPEIDCRAFTEHRCQTNFKINECLFEGILIQLSDEKYVWYMNQHHLATDGWSAANLYKRVSDYYQKISSEKSLEVKELPAYQKYISHEIGFRETENYKKTLNYWQKKFNNPTDTPVFYDRSVGKSGTRTERAYCDLGVERSQKIKDIAMENGVRSLTIDITLFNIFSAFLFTWLYRASQNKKLSIGTFAHNRATEQFKNSLGLFIELYPLYTTIDTDETFLSLIQKTGKEAFGFLSHAQPGTGNVDLDHPYGAILNFINASFSEFAGMSMNSRWVHPGHGDRGHSLRLQVHDFDNSGSFQLHFDFNTEVFDEELRGFAVQHFLQIIDAFIENCEMSLSEIDLLGKKNRDYILKEYNKTSINSSEQTVVQLFEATAAKKGEAIAVEDKAQKLSYRELNFKATQLAHHLSESGFAVGHIAGICCERSIEMVIAVMAVLKNGGAYVPIDPAYPRDRIAMMLEDTGAKIVLTQRALKSLIPGKCSPIFMEDEYPNISIDSDKSSLKYNSLEDTAYIIYTSGSSGKPKGVEIQHKALVNYLVWAKKQYVGESSYSFPLFSSFSADLTITSIFLPLISGGRIVIYGEEKDGVDLSILKVLDDDKVDIVKLTPSHLSLVKDKNIRDSRLKKIIVGGEDYKTALARKILDVFPQEPEIYNEYGPTEATVGCMIHRFDPERDISISVPIGKPVDNMQIYVLDEEMKLVPFGFHGEIFIAGTALAKGYLNQTKLTEERFVKNPFSAGKKMYRTGDLARWNSNGLLEFLGRKDEQVKVRGFRIELGEVGSTLNSHSEIKESVVTVIEQMANEESELNYCRNCGLASNHPDAKIAKNGICNVCHNYENQKEYAHHYFKTKDQLTRVFDDAKANRTGKYDCMMLLSGGKDSTYVLHQLVGMGLTPLVFSMDNGYISEQAKVNVKKVVDGLGLDLIWGTTPAMNEIFVDSLKRFSNVCNGCYKVIYTLSVNLAREKGIKYIVTGLSRGQFFETRVAQLFKNKIFNSKEIDQNIIEARKAYHRMDDTVSRNMDVSVFQKDDVYTDIKFIDYFRYTDVELHEMLDFLENRTDWVRPTDTGRSTNCLINEAGIYVHKKERGFHNYALPYSWDVRLGHKDRKAALEELDDDIDETDVNKVLNEIGYKTQEKLVEDKRLAAYYVSETDIPNSELRDFLSQTLPSFMIPSHFIRLKEMPLNSTGKIDRKALPLPGSDRVKIEAEYVEPQNEKEEILVKIWQSVIQIDKVGTQDNFFDLGGDSILNIQIVARANQQGLKLTSGQLFDYPTISKLASLVSTAFAQKASQEIATGTAAITPIQHWFLEQELENQNHWNMAIKIDLSKPVDPKVWRKAYEQVVSHHDGFGLRFSKSDGSWQQSYSKNSVNNEHFRFIDLSAFQEEIQAEKMKSEIDSVQKDLNIENGPLVKSILFQLTEVKQSLFITSHHLVIDGISWQILLEDLAKAYKHIEADEKVQFPAKTFSFKNWSNQLQKYAQSAQLQEELSFWQDYKHKVPHLPVDFLNPANNVEESSQTLFLSLTKEETENLLQNASKPYRTKINELLMVALAQVINRWTKSSTFYVNMEGHGREETVSEMDFSRTVGWFTSIFPVQLSLNETDSLPDKIKSVKEQFRKIPNNGIGYGVLRYLNSSAKNLHLLAEPQILFNYLGQTDQLINSSSVFSENYQISGSHSPTALRRYLLEINSFVVKGQLQVHWTFSKNYHLEQTIRAQAENYIKAMQDLIAHCLSPDAGGITPTDFPMANLSNDKLGKLSKLLGE